MSDFTKGPWKVRDIEDGRLYVLDSKGYDVCRLYCLGPREEDEANARLIAAAPTMLEAMNALYDHMLELMTEGDIDDRDNATCPLCHLPEPGNFDSIHEDDHHDRCSWPAFLKARSLAQDVRR